MDKTKVTGRIFLILVGSTISILSIHGIYISSLKKEDFKTYTGKPINTHVELKKEPRRNRHDLVKSDSLVYVEMYIKLEYYDKEFVIGNRLSDQFIIIKQLIQKANVLTIRARKDIFKKNEYRVYQIDSNRRNDIVSLDETTDPAKDSVFLLIFGLAIILLGIFGKLKGLDFEDDGS